MTEQEYINTTHKTKISSALLILESIPVSEINKQGMDLIQARILLRDLELLLGGMIKLEESE